MFIYRKLKPISKVILLFSCSVTLLIGCNEVFEDDLSNKSITIITPDDDYISPSNQIQFWWDELSGADWYHIQIVKPSFSGIQTLVMDTNVTGDNFTCIFPYGQYEWRIRPENSAYQGTYVVRSFTIESDSDLTFYVIPLISPSQLDTINQTLLSFSWQSIPYANTYSFAIWQPAYGGTVVYSNFSSTNSHQYTFPADGTFEWGVKASNSQSSTVFFTRKIYIDTQIPTIPTLISPVDNDTITTTPVNFIWTHVSGGSSITDSILISSDISFNSIVLSAASTSTSLTTNLSSGTYFWKVKSTDAAGNAGNYSSYRTLTIE